MGSWVEQSKDCLLPTWLSTELNSSCVYCGSPMLNYYNDVGRCTNRKCSNDNCPGFIAARAEFVCKLLKIDGMGFKSCLKDLRIFKANTVFELLNAWHIKPTVPLSVFLRMHCFEGVDNAWEDICQTLSVYTLEELYERYDGKWKQLLIDKREEIENNLKYVTLAGKPENMVKTGPKYVLTIMITGTPIGYASKDDFIYTVNDACRGLIVVKHQKTKRQTGVDCLIREPGSTTRGKVEAAVKGGIPILTSAQFVNFLTELMGKIKSEGENK